MSGWTAKRFWTDVTVSEREAGYAIALDSRPVRTPGKLELIVPTREMAEKVADEWRAVDKIVDPSAMHWTRSANSAIEKVGPNRAGVEAHLAEYAATDLLCYRAEGPDELIVRQAAAWDPLLDRAASDLGAALNVTRGVMPVDQPPASIGRLAEEMTGLSDFELTGFHDLVTLSGSFVIAVAALRNWDSLEVLWAASHVDETYQVEQWGADDEAAERATLRKEGFVHAADFLLSAKKLGSINGLQP